MAVVHSDKQLTARMLRGEKAAFDAFFDANFPRLYRFTLGRIGNDEDAAKEIVQKTLCRAISRLHTYRGEAALFTWLCRLCRNEISDHFKRVNRDAARQLAFDDAEVLAVLESLDDGDANDPTRSAERDQLGQIIHSILDYLPVRQSTVLESKYIQGMTVAEIASQMNISQQAVQSLLARARQSFRDGFAELAQTDLNALLRN